jgi:hypothetical protein
VTEKKSLGHWPVTKEGSLNRNSDTASKVQAETYIFFLQVSLENVKTNLHM